SLRSGLARRTPSLGAESREALLGGGARLFFFAKRKTDLRGAVARVVVETGAGDNGHADFFDKVVGEAHVLGFRGKLHGGGIGETRNIGHDVVSAPRLEIGRAHV